MVWLFSKFMLLLADLQCTTMGLFSVLRCTLFTSSTTVTMVCGLEHSPFELQFWMWNWVTWCDLPDYMYKSDTVSQIKWLVYFQSSSRSALLKIQRKMISRSAYTNLVYSDRQCSLHIATKLLLWYQLNIQVTIVHTASAWPVLLAYWLWVGNLFIACSLAVICFTYLSIFL